MCLVAPSVLDVKDEGLTIVINELARSGADWIHFDVIDWKRTSSKRNYPVQDVKQIKQGRFFDFHLMVDDIKGYINRYLDVADGITIHSKSRVLVEYIKTNGRLVGVAINPNESFEGYKDIVKLVDILLFMGVYPGYGGQKFIPDIVKNIEKAWRYRKENNLSFRIQVDGGVNAESYPLVKGKVDIVVAGSFIIKAKNKKQVIQSFKGD